MRHVSYTLVLRVALIAAIAASAALVVEYQNPGDPAFCGVGSGCHQVRIAPQTRAFTELLGGITLPQLGLVTYLGLLVASLLGRARLYRWMIAAITIPGALFAGYLIYIQKSEIGSFCPWCLLVDGAAIVAAIAATAGVLDDLRRERAGGFARDENSEPGASPASEDHDPRGRAGAEADEQAPRWRELAGNNRALPWWGAAGVLAATLPSVWGSYPVVPPVPDDVAKFASAGRVIVL